jgi:hypothetical protein
MMGVGGGVAGCRINEDLGFKPADSSVTSTCATTFSSSKDIPLPDSNDVPLDESSGDDSLASEYV